MKVVLPLLLASAAAQTAVVTKDDICRDFREHVPSICKVRDTCLGITCGYEVSLAGYGIDVQVDLTMDPCSKPAVMGVIASSKAFSSVKFGEDFTATEEGSNKLVPIPNLAIDNMLFKGGMYLEVMMQQTGDVIKQKFSLNMCSGGSCGQELSSLLTMFPIDLFEDSTDFSGYCKPPTPEPTTLPPTDEAASPTASGGEPGGEPSSPTPAGGPEGGNSTEDGGATESGSISTAQGAVQVATAMVAGALLFNFA